MGKLTSPFFLLLVGFFQAGELKLMSLVGNERYVQDNNLDETIDETSCKGIEFHDYPDYADYCDPKYDGDECDDEPVCHFSKLNVTLEKEGRHPGVASCCPFHGFVEVATCAGTDKNGDRIEFSGIDVCLHHSGSKTPTYRPVKKCNSSCHLVKGFLSEDPGSSINGTTLLHKGKEYSDFCLSLRCDNAGERFDHWFEACGDCKNTTVINAELREQWTRTQPQQRTTNASIANCCGPDGILNKKTKSCNTDFNNSVLLSTCTLESKQSIEVSTNISDPGLICVSRMDGAESGGLVCRHHCPGKGGCVQACMGRHDALDFEKNELVRLEEAPHLTKVLGVSPDEIEIVYGEERRCHSSTNKTILYPEWQCDDRVKIKPGGDLVMENDPLKTLGYGEFCIEPLAEPDKHQLGSIRGTYMVRTCWEKPEKEENGKNFVYYTVVLCISIICLVATISIYVVFREALLRTEYNKFMLNFTSMLLLAFLTLVVQQNLDGSAMTPITCSAVTLVNQFSIIAAFTLMTLMSYSICRQIHGMKVMDPQTRYMRRLMIAYSIPAVITFLTLIVEVSAPHCAAAKPNFGVKSCHFYGGVGKFVWLYLPILLLLIINTAMFAFIAINIFKNHSSNKKGSRSEKVDTMCIYLRLFLGMGIIWYFEILAFALTSYKLNANIFILTDTLNMCQGVWAFIIFVCKRNVMKVVRGKSNRLYSLARQMSRQMSMGGGSGGGKHNGKGRLTPASSVDKTEDVSITASVNEPHADTHF